MPIRGYRQSRLPRAKLIGGDHLKCEQLEVEFENACKICISLQPWKYKIPD